MRTWNAEDEIFPLSSCPWHRDLDDAQSVARQLGISFEVVNMIDQYREHVVKNLVNGYANGTTPNPDILCNRHIKFGTLYEHVKSRDCEMIATGHYCKKVRQPDGSYDLYEGNDKTKDQSYFLASLSQNQIKSALFPLGDYDKLHVRFIANKLNLRTANKKDSQGICFLGKVKLQNFLAQYIPNAHGNIMCGGKVIGRHRGLFKFTVGQRHGINLPSNIDNKHYVVVGKDVKNNILFVEIEDENSALLYKSNVVVRNLSFTNKPIGDGISILAKPRYRDLSQQITFQYLDKFGALPGDTAFVRFKTKQRALASGQIIAFYAGERLLGCGTYV
jgi:tRNA-specific 2-thiouridylase